MNKESLPHGINVDAHIRVLRTSIIVELTKVINAVADAQVGQDNEAMLAATRALTGKLSLFVGLVVSNNHAAVAQHSSTERGVLLLPTVAEVRACFPDPCDAASSLWAMAQACGLTARWIELAPTT